MKIEDILRQIFVELRNEQCCGAGAARSGIILVEPEPPELHKKCCFSATQEMSDILNFVSTLKMSKSCK
jgi:hypothetical protein